MEPKRTESEAEKIPEKEGARTSPGCTTGLTEAGLKATYSGGQAVEEKEPAATAGGAEGAAATGLTEAGLTATRAGEGALVEAEKKARPGRIDSYFTRMEIGSKRQRVVEEGGEKVSPFAKKTMPFPFSSPSGQEGAETVERRTEERVEEERVEEEREEGTEMTPNVGRENVLPDPVRGNIKWSTMEAEKQEIYLKPEQLPDEFKPTPFSSRDISLAVEKRLSDTEKLEFLDNHFKPDANYNYYPVFQAGRNRFPQPAWLSQPLLAFSHVEHGFYCVSCVLFGSELVGRGGHQAVGKFSKKPFRHFKDFTEAWQSHTGSTYHQSTAVYTENFQKRMHSGTTVQQEVSAGYTATVKKNRLLLKGIIKAVQFCARNELPLRGHSDSGRLEVENPGSSEGIFREVLRLLVKSGDEGAKLVTEAGGNSAYLSPKIQNELIGCLAEGVLEPIVKAINSAPCFSLLADETGVHEQEFLTVCVRHPTPEGKLREDFLGYVHMEDTTAESIANALIDHLNVLGINWHKLVGQGYDGAANMAGRLKGVQKRIRDLVPQADYFHCVNHNLNLALGDGSGDLHISRAIQGVQKIGVFFDGSAKRTGVLRASIEELIPTSRRKGIAQLAPTRWVQRHETLAAFKELLPAIVDALRKLNQGENTSVASDLLGGLSTFASIFSIVAAEKVAGDLKFLANFLQTKNLDLLRAYDEIDAVRRVLQSYLDEPEVLDEVFNESKQLCEKLGIKDDVLSWEVDRPMVLRSYVRERIYDTYLGGIIGGIDQRFGKRQLTAFKLQLLLPARVKELSYEAVSDVVTQYESLLPSPSDVPSEISRWRMKWILTDKGANSVIDAIADPIVFLSYPNIHRLLQILATLPVSTATPERSFSTLGRIFTDQRASMGTKRVSQLALLSTYKKELDLLDVDKVLDNFAAKSTRRLDLK